MLVYVIVHVHVFLPPTRPAFIFSVSGLERCCVL